MRTAMPDIAGAAVPFEINPNPKDPVRRRLPKRRGEGRKASRDTNGKY